MNAIDLSSNQSFSAGAERLLGQAQREVAGGGALVETIVSGKLSPKNSLVGDVPSLRAQQRALDLLDSVLDAARGVFAQVPVAQNVAASGEAGESGNPVDRLLADAKLGEMPLFDTGVLNSRSIERVLAAPEGESGLDIFSNEVRGSLRAMFDGAFDLYA